MERISIAIVTILPLFGFLLPPALSDRPITDYDRASHPELTQVELASLALIASLIMIEFTKLSWEI